MREKVLRNLIHMRIIIIIDTLRRKYFSRAKNKINSKGEESYGISGIDQTKI